MEINEYLKLLANELGKTFLQKNEVNLELGIYVSDGKVLVNKDSPNRIKFKITIAPKK